MVKGDLLEAVLTGTNGVEVLSAARLSKVQTRARNKETLLEIINSTELSDAQKQEAVDSMVRMTDIAEKEAAAEVPAGKGFSEGGSHHGMPWMRWSSPQN